MGDTTVTKSWYTSKTVLAAIISALIALYNTIAPQFGWPAIPEFVYGILAALGIYSRITATATLTK